MNLTARIGVQNKYSTHEPGIFLKGSFRSGPERSTRHSRGESNVNDYVAMSKPADSGSKTVSFTVPIHLLDAFVETANDFFARVHEGTTPAQRAAEIRSQDKDAGIDSLASLLDVAQCDAGQAEVIARFLAGL